MRPISRPAREKRAAQHPPDADGSEEYVRYVLSHSMDQH